MPELPEVESIRRGLAEHLTGRRILTAQAFGTRVTRRAPQGLEAVEGRTVRAVVRRGKFLWCDVGEDLALLAHLGMSGQFRVDEPSGNSDTGGERRHLRARFELDNGRVLDFVDQRTFGYLAPVTFRPTDDGGPGGAGSKRAVVPVPVAHIARDLLDPFLNETALLGVLTTTRRAMKRVLLDQEIISGIGNIYADEMLYRARIHPEATALTAAAARELLNAGRAVLNAALAAGGTSFDRLYVHVNGESGYFERSLQAYGRAGQPCARCGTPLQKIILGGRSTTLCPVCQVAPIG
ncbi:bifunctional DNA-formamidopyrimidine glycosylase/DNA-(apurinic or apyrimidinic site) lyase [Actinotignum sanguinis]|uniref:Bifunctional DNA-formamidopyrimidine glycosylase/DNA-(Apurinic or apyrimidinic site) lyase n=1 Tax=Actinotignum sanguinis TaxID=1445614 RepID=A0ABT5V3J9_9ACTO|nr:bifunctional DNA-formamidopyrimidine glycosylase/DNA-(apurinic or apyrimidinic site) lyase [Actinotignum sanguinis]MDE1655557.1 bifunctional DNA-formamidopyrimidine glycosylase/DNA-(apurinic or apyrimidinic site) lyase [Actinotignum sanguinis]